MMRRIFFVLLLLSAGGVSASDEAAEQSVVFSEQQIKIGQKTLRVEIADSNEKRARGLMFRKALASGHGMLFVFETEEPLAFWMKNTLIPLSIGYFDQSQRLINILDMEPAVAGEVNPKTYHSQRPAKFALEVPKGWFSRNKVEPGAHFSFVK